MLLINAQHVKRVPGRKTDVSDSEWLAELLRVVNRVQKVLEGANLKLASVVSDIQGVSAQAMLAEIAGGKTDAAALAQLARGRLRHKLPELEKALTGLVQPHHRFLLAQQLAHIDFLDEQIADLGAEIARQVEAMSQPPTAPMSGKSLRPGSCFDLAQAVALFADELHHRDEEVEVEVQEFIQLVEEGNLSRGVIAQITDKATHGRPVFLLDIATVVFAVGAATREGNLFLLTIAVEFVVDELAAIVRVNPTQRERQSLARMLQPGKNVFLRLIAYGYALGPGRFDIGDGQSQTIISFPHRTRPSLFQQSPVDLHSSRPRCEWQSAP